MKKLIFITTFYFLLGFTYLPPENSVSLNDDELSELCGGYSALLSEVDNKGVSFLHCDCMCANEENLYFLKSPSGTNFYEVKASKLSEKIEKEEICKSSRSIIYEEGFQYFAVRELLNKSHGACYNIFGVDVSKKAIHQTGRHGSYETVKKLDNAKGQKLANVLNTLSDRKKKFYRQITKKKSYLFQAPSNNFRSKMYLIKGDKVTLLSEKIDQSKQKWFFVNYKGKKELNMWVKSEAIGALVDLPNTPQKKIKYLYINQVKAYLYSKPMISAKTKMYLIKKDKVVFFAEEKDEHGQKWLLVNFKGKKDLYMWIKTEAVDLK